MAEPTDDLIAEAKRLKIDLSGEETETEIKTLIEMVNIMDEPKGSEIMVISTALGALPVKGLIPIGEKFMIQVEQFSEAWMKPASAIATKAVKAELAKRAEKKKSGAA